MPDLKCSYSLCYIGGECVFCERDRLKALVREGEDKCEITCLTCQTKFSVNNGDEEVNWTCPVCALRSLVREMAKKMDYCADWFAPPGHGHQLADEIREILDRPEVREIMKEVEGG